MSELGDQEIGTLLRVREAFGATGKVTPGAAQKKLAAALDARSPGRQALRDALVTVEFALPRLLGERASFSELPPDRRALLLARANAELGDRLAQTLALVETALMELPGTPAGVPAARVGAAASARTTAPAARAAAKAGSGLAWSAFAASRPFLISFAEAILGDQVIKDVGRKTVDRFEDFLAKAPEPVRDRLVLAVTVMPPGPIERWIFQKKSLAERMAFVAKLFAEYAGRPPHPIVDTTLILSSVKSLLSGCYMELPEVRKRIDYSPRPAALPRNDAGAVVVPPTGKSLRPSQSREGKELHDRVEDPDSLPDTIKGVDTCIIGSGAGGAAVGWALLGPGAAGPKQKVVMLESGGLHTNEAFGDSVLDAVAALYFNCGATQSAKDRTLFRQGHCVGGSTTVNNAVCIRPNAEWLARLQSRWPLGPARWAALQASYDALAPRLDVHTIEDYLVTQAARVLRDGLAPSSRLEKLTANLRDCIGCGLCNLGCRYDAKRAPLVTLILDYLRAGGRLVPRAPATEIVFRFDPFSSTRHVDHVRFRTPGGRSKRLHARRFVLAAGCLASSSLLMRSGFTGKGLFAHTVGKRFSCNFGSAVIGRFDEPVFGGRGQQIGYVFHMPEDDIVIESAFAPPTAMGMLAPQLGARFHELAGAYNHLAAAAPTIASSTENTITSPVLGGDPGIGFKLTASDWARLAKGMRIGAQALARSGAREIYDTRFSGESLPILENGSADDLQRIENFYSGIDDRTYLKVESAHLQGGNVIHPDPAKGVVDEGLKVHGVDNLWICDASVFPAPITLNLQYTVMALAHAAAPGMTE